MIRLPATEELARACAAAPFDVRRFCDAVDAFARPVMRQRLFTVNRFEPETMHLVRLYSSSPSDYPPGGRKDKRAKAWGEKVLLQHRMHVGEGVAAMRADFDDHATIERLGLRSVINVPVVFQGCCLGTANFLMADASVDPEQIEFARLVGVLLLPLFAPAGHAVAPS